MSGGFSLFWKGGRNRLCDMLREAVASGWTHGTLATGSGGGYGLEFGVCWSCRTERVVYVNESCPDNAAYTALSATSLQSYTCVVVIHVNLGFRR